MAIADPPTLEVVGLGKKLTSDLAQSRRHGVHDIWDELRLATRPRGDRLRPSEFWALRDVSFSVSPGEALGVIGFNGAGKSTLLRTLHGITRPDAGSITIQGPHVAMLNLGAPFSKLLSGRENILTAAAVHGIKGKDVESLVAAVADFSGLGPLLDAPMATYSTGMGLRIGYGITANLPASLLLVDEVIAVGDLGFQRKCLAHIRGHLDRGGSVVLVSHDLWMIQALCNRCLVLVDGRIEVEGTANHAISAYLRRARRSQVHTPRSHVTADGPDEAPAPVATIEVTSCAGPDGADPRNGDDLVVQLAANAVGSSIAATWRIDVLTANQQVCLASARPPDHLATVEIGPGPTSITCVMPDLPLLPGTFYLRAHLHDPVSGLEIGNPAPAVPFEVASRHTRLDVLAQIPGAGALSSIHATWFQPGDPPTGADASPPDLGLDQPERA